LQARSLMCPYTPPTGMNRAHRFSLVIPQVHLLHVLPLLPLPPL
jgi:hypothetical protein